MKKILNSVLVGLTAAAAFSCSNMLEVTNPSIVDNDFVFSSYETGKTVMLGAYNSYVGQVNNNFTAQLETIGSDVERCSVGLIADLVGAAQLYGGPESYHVENFNIDGSLKGFWDTFYGTIAKCNQVIYNIEKRNDFDNIKSTAPNDWSDLLGQAYALRATMYYDIARIYGDMVYMDAAGKDIRELSPRDYVIEKEIQNLIKVEPWMYSIGEKGHMPDQMTRNYVDGLIGRMCFMEAGYATRRTDLGADFYKDADGKQIQFEVWGKDDARKAEYARRTDWKKFYEMALPFLKKGVETPAGAQLVTVDNRSDKEGRTFNNPYQLIFNDITCLRMSEESIYEVTMRTERGTSRIAYNFGRGSSGGGTAYPPKSNAQICTYPETFYGLFDNADLRREVTSGVTGSNGAGAEVLYDAALSNKNTIGIGMNKYDLNRHPNPDARQLYSGINYIVMRQADMILMLAEAYAQTGNTSAAAAELKKVHNRAFPDNVQDAKYDELLARNGGDILKAIIEERKLEFVGENLRRWDLIRTGEITKVAVDFRKKLVKDIENLKTQGYTTYANGNVYPTYVWTKLVDARKLLGYRLTAQTPADYKEPDWTKQEEVERYGLLFPGWRGQHDDWEKVALEDDPSKKPITAGNNTNLSIIGLNEYIAPDSAKAKALEAMGFVKTSWGAEMFNDKNGYSAAREAQWSTEFLCGYSDADYSAKKAPIYLVPMRTSVCQTTGLTNGYGFKSGK